MSRIGSAAAAASCSAPVIAASSATGRCPRNASVRWRWSRDTGRPSRMWAACHSDKPASAESGSRRAQKSRARSRPSRLAGSFTRLRRDSVSRKEPPHEVERRRRGAAPDRVAVARKDEVGRAAAVGPARVQVDEPDRLLGRAAARPGDPGDRHSNVGTEPRARTCGHGLSRLRRHRTEPLQHLARNVELARLHAVRISDDGTEEDVARAGYRRQPPRDEPARARLRSRERQTARAAELEHELLHRPLVTAEEILLERSDELRRVLIRARLGAGLDEEVDVDLEIASTDGRLHAVAVAARIGQRLRDGGLARAEEAQEPHLGRLRTAEQAPHRFGPQRLDPQPAEFGRRPRQDDHDGAARLEYEAGRGARQPERERTLGDRRLLAHAGLEVDVRPAHPRREPPRDAADLVVQPLVQPQADPGGAGDERNGAIVVRRAEPARDDAQVGSHALAEGLLQLLLAVAHDHDALWLDAEPQELGGDERPVPVGAVAADELAAGNDDDSPRARQTPGLMPRDVTISVLTPPRGSRRV